MLPLRHCPRVIARAQAASYQAAQQAPAYALLHRGDGVRVEPGRGTEDDTTGQIGLEHDLDDHAVEVQVGIERQDSARGNGADHQN